VSLVATEQAGLSLRWIVSYPRSGNQVTRVALANYLLDRSASPEEMNRLAPEITSLAAEGRLLPIEGPLPLIGGTMLLPDAPLLRRYKSATAKVLYLVRNPREVIPSAVRRLDISVSKRADFARHFITQGGISDLIPGMWGPWPEHVRAWTSPEALRRYFPNAEVLPMRFEDLKREPVGNMRRIVDFFGIDDPADPARVERAIANLAADKMDAAAAHEQRLSHMPFVYNPPAPCAEPPCRNLADFGEDIEAEYLRLLAHDAEFLSCAKQFGYEA
jgi:hypothetical protein